MGAHPAAIPLVYTVKAIVLIGIRWILYRSRKWGLFTYDMCYVRLGG